MTSARRKARTVALKALYEFDSVGHDPIASMWRLAQEESLPEDVATFAQDIVAGVLEHKDEIDNQLQKFAPNFPVEQISIVDRSVLRMAIFEISFDSKAPIKVAINEAVELAKAFGSRNSPRFVNGVLGSISAMVPHR